MTDYTIVLLPGEDGALIAQCVDLPGCISQGRTEADALANIREAIELCLDAGETPRPALVKTVRVRDRNHAYLSDDERVTGINNALNDGERSGVAPDGVFDRVRARVGITAR